MVVVVMRVVLDRRIIADDVASQPFQTLAESQRSRCLVGMFLSPGRHAEGDQTQEQDARRDAGSFPNHETFLAWSSTPLYPSPLIGRDGRQSLIDSSDFFGIAG